MSETVTITPFADRDADGNPVSAGAAYSLTAKAVAPGNTMLAYRTGGDVEEADFTVFLPLGSVINDNDLIMVRGKKCSARVQVWDSAWNTGRGGVVVLAKAVSGRG